ncbi:bublin coiled-coil protein [Achroia grisella]|uniref:bublin coiled-coil protein n=1 Tax=Achroia grisella TaxID=688607 RepID=UPI0027D28E7D|nr:bublin coiled-coil protein [Achroia grisella]XP_059048883.1 bublin coiled-coil protein [Achroia grisella]XP_059048884.1 bublin coiled-coil protein [Achroia grisella]XP_059048885.1 bublin coiled-coil protein [Achroia grisella]
MAGHDDNITKEENTESIMEIEPTAQGPNTDENLNEEYYMLDSKLDELNLALDFLEQKTDDINEKLKELLQSNIEIRNELRNENNSNESQ